MTTWTLLIFLAYSGGADMGGVALEKFNLDYFSLDECKAARREQIKDFVEAGFKRFTVTCHKRSGPFLEPEKVSK
jgi:hypothetical protein